jgi:hypothetical protein
MRAKLTCGLIIIIFILNAIFVSWNNEFKADAPESNPKEISRNIPQPLSNGGLNWSQMEVISEPVSGQNFSIGNSAQPSIAVENDNIYVVWNENNNTNGAGTDLDIFYRYFNGNQWSDVQVISEPIPGNNFNTAHSLAPAIAVENGSIYIVWFDSNNTNGAGTSDWDIFYRCNLTGSSWEDIQVISEPIIGNNKNNGSSRRPAIAVENGNIYVVWTDDNETNGASNIDRDIFYRCNLTGTSWEDVQVISEPIFGQNINIAHSGGPNIAVENGNIYVVWDDMNNTNGAGSTYDVFYTCNLTGSSWEPVQVISEPVFGQDFNIQLSYNGGIAVENGKVFIVWMDANDTNGAGNDMDISYRCNLTGTSWEDIQVVSEPVEGFDYNIAYSHAPGIAVKNNKIHVVWTDQNNTNGAGTDYDIFYRSNLTGLAWEPMQVISEPVFGMNLNTAGVPPPSQYASIAVNDKVHVVWNDDNNTDGSGTDLDINYRWKNIVLPSLFLNFPKVNPKFGNTSTEFNFTVIYTQLNNTPPTIMKVIIDGIEYSMLEVDQTDANYTNGKKYYFRVKNLDIGSHTYEFNASDGINYTNTRLFSNLNVVNTLPQIITTDNLTAMEDEYYESNYEFTDMDIANVGQACHWEFESNASWLNFDLILGKLNGTPGNDEVGPYWVYIAVNDTMDIVFTNFTLIVVDVNDDPLITTIDVKQAIEDEFYEVDYDASDIDSALGNQLWSFETNATAWLNISSTSGILNGTPGNIDVGEYWINISVDDNEGGIDFSNFTLTVLNINDDPEIIHRDLLITSAGELYEIDYEATDIDSPITKQIWSLDTNATWLQINSSSGLLSGIPAKDDTGWYYVNVSVSDGDGGSDWYRFEFRVVKGNMPPMIITNDVEIAMVNETYIVDYYATDDQPVGWLIWLFETNASWLSFKGGALNGTPTANHGGKQYWVNLSVRDSKNELDFHNFTIKVLKEPKIVIKNNIPTLMNFKMEPSEGNIKTEFTFLVNYLDLDNETPETIQVVIDGNVFNMHLKAGEIPYSGQYEYKTTLSEGEHTYYFTASDGSDSNTTDTFTTPNIKKLEKVNGNGADKEGLAWEWLIGIIVVIVIIIVILIIAFLMIMKKKREEEEMIPPTPEISESIGETEQPMPPESPITPTPHQEYEMQQPEIQQDLYYTPPEEPATDATFESLEQPEQAREEEVEELEE